MLCAVLIAIEFVAFYCLLVNGFIHSPSHWSQRRSYLSDINVEHSKPFYSNEFYSRNKPLTNTLDNVSPNVNPTSTLKTLYLSGLTDETTEEDVRTTINNLAGNDLVTNIQLSHLTKHQPVFAIVDFISVEATQRAYQLLQHKTINHRRVGVNYSLPNRNKLTAGKEACTLFVGNLPDIVDRDTLIQLLTEICNPLNIKGEAVRMGQRTQGITANFAYIVFSSHQDAVRAMEQLNCIKLHGATLKVNFAYNQLQKPAVTYDLIIQNLDLSVSVEDIYYLCGSYVNENDVMPEVLFRQNVGPTAVSSKYCYVRFSNEMVRDKVLVGLQGMTLMGKIISVNKPHYGYQQQQQQQSRDSGGENGNVIVLRGIPNHVSNQQLWIFLTSRFGEKSIAGVRRGRQADNGDLLLPYAHVTFDNEFTAKQALIELNLCDLEGSELTAQPFYLNAIVNNIGEGWTKTMFHRKLSEVLTRKGFEDAMIRRDVCGIVQFKNREQMETALVKLNGLIIEGRRWEAYAK